VTRRNWTVPVLGVGAALLVGYALTHRVPVERPDPPPRPSPTAAAELPGLDGEPATAPEGLRLLVDGRHPQVLDARTGAGAPLPGLSVPDGAQVRLRAVPGGTIADILDSTRPSTVLLTGGAPVTLGDGGVQAVPAARGTDLLVVQGDAVRRMTRAGPVTRSWTSAQPLRLVRDTPAGLVASRSDDLVLLDASTGALRRIVAPRGTPLATTDAVVAWLPDSCRESCGVVVTELDTGAHQHYGLPPGTPGEAAFSPDGRWLAVSVPGQYRNGRLAVEAGSVSVVDLRTGAVWPVPGVRTGPERQADVSWSGPDLVLGVWTRDRARLALWSPVDRGPLRVLPVEPRGDDKGSVTALP
jgi:hypothetical protein